MDSSAEAGGSYKDCSIDSFFQSKHENKDSP